MRFSLRTLLIACTAVPALIGGLVWWWSMIDMRRKVDIELHFAAEPNATPCVVFHIDKQHGINPTKVSSHVYRIDVPETGEVTLASGDVFHRWHQVFIVTPTHKERRLAFESAGSRWDLAYETKQLPSGTVRTTSSEDGSRYTLVLRPYR